MSPGFAAGAFLCRKVTVFYLNFVLTKFFFVPTDVFYRTYKIFFPQYGHSFLFLRMFFTVKKVDFMMQKEFFRVRVRNFFAQNHIFAEAKTEISR